MKSGQYFFINDRADFRGQTADAVIPALIFPLFLGHGDKKSFLSVNNSQTFNQYRSIDAHIDKGSDRACIRELINPFDF